MVYHLHRVELLEIVREWYGLQFVNVVIRIYEVQVIKLQNISLQNKQNDFLMVVTSNQFFFRIKSPIDPKIIPAKNLAKYGRLAKTPDFPKLNPSTCTNGIAALNSV